ncbi:MAG: adenylyl-sulfate kinase [Acidimicrobiales bacterium]
MTGAAAPGPGEPTSANTLWHPSAVARTDRWATVGGDAPGVTVWLTGLSGSGKSSVAVELEAALVRLGRAAYLLDGDNLRQGLNGDLGFSAADRDENVRRVAHVARLFADAGLVAIVPLISPYRAGRDLARRLHDAAGLGFVEVFVDTPLDECERRDPKGLYAKARRGELSGMTGIDAPYEPPLDPELRYVPADGDAATIAGRIITNL